MSIFVISTKPIAMQKITLLLFLLTLSLTTAQTRSQSKLITKIERQIHTAKVSKIDTIKKVGWSGGYEKITVYLRRNVPILVEKEEKEVVHLYLTDNTERDDVTLITAKFYIIDWPKGDFIRTGTIRYMGTDPAAVETMPKEYIFEFDKSEIQAQIDKRR